MFKGKTKSILSAGERGMALIVEDWGNVVIVETDKGEIMPCREHVARKGASLSASLLCVPGVSSCDWPVGSKHRLNLQV